MNNSRNIQVDLFGAPIRQETINSKKKGDSNEYAFSKWLKKWTGEKFTKVPSSGGMRWQNTVNTCGDVVCENADFEFIFSVETKHYKEICFNRTLKSNSKVAKFYRQAKDDAERASKLPLLALRKNGMPKNTWVLYFSFKLPNRPIYSSCMIEDGQEIFGYLSEYIIEKVSYKEVLSIVENGSIFGK